MTPSEIINLALERVSMTTTEVGDGNSTTGLARCYQYLNMVKDKIWNKYVSSATGKDRSWESWTQDFTINQSEYPLPQVISDDNRLKKVQSLYVTYGTSTYSRTGKLIYTKATQADISTLEEDWDWYCANQAETDPIYYTSDKSIFIAPTPTSTITNGLKLTGIKKIPDYTSTTAESDMVIPDDIHELLIDGLVPHLLWKKGASAQAQSQKNDFTNTTKETLDTERDFHIGPHFATYPTEPIRERRGVYSTPNPYGLP